MYYIIIDLIGMFCIISFQLLLVQVHCLRSHLQKFRKLIEIQFQPGRSTTQVTVKVYKELQILTTCYNKIHDDGVMILTVNFTVFCLVLCLYGLIVEMANLTSLQTILLVCMTIDAILLITVSFGGMAKLHTESTQLKQLIDSRLVMAQKSKRNRRMLKMYSRSFKLLVIRVGTVFFFDRLTTFNIMNFSINALVNLLLLIN